MCIADATAVVNESGKYLLCMTMLHWLELGALDLQTIDFLAVIFWQSQFWPA